MRWPLRKLYVYQYFSTPHLPFSEEDNDDDNDVIDEKKTYHERDYVKLSTSSGPYSLDLDNLDNDEPCLSGTWEHDIQVWKYF